ncbi:MAG: response regulator, partial [Anaerolineae bacterium]
MKNKKLRVLIAEDDYLVSEMVQGLINELNYDIVGEAVTGPQVVAMAADLRPDVVIMDIQMPEFDGIEATQRIQQTCPMPVVILTAYETPELIERASEAGANAYLVKPANARGLDRVITIARARFEDMQALRQLNDQLQTYNKELDAFAHTVAHDLQSPLSLVIGFSDLLRESAAHYSPEKVTEILDTISRNARKMSSIVDELMLLAGVRKMDVTLESVDVLLMALEAKQRLAHQIMEKGVILETSDAWPRAMGYAPWIEEVWANYLSNGIKYGGEPPRLQMGAGLLEDGMVKYWVRDNGRGLSPEDQEKLFIPFTQLKQVRAKGHGLGLS